MESEGKAVHKEVMAYSEIRHPLKRSATIGIDGNSDVSNWRWILLYFVCVCLLVHSLSMHSCDLFH